MTEFSREIRKDYYTTPRTSLEAYGKRLGPDDFDMQMFRSTAFDAAVLLAGLVALLVWVNS